MDKNYHVFRNMFVFMESGKLHDDLYAVIKDELAYVLDNKYSIYMDKIFDVIGSEEGKFYTYFASVLKKVSLPLGDGTVENLDDYVKGFDGMPRSGELKATLLILTLIQQEITRLCYDIISVNTEARVSKKLGIFAYINEYLKDPKRSYVSIESFLNKCYNIVYDNAKLHFGGLVYGKKY